MNEIHKALQALIRAAIECEPTQEDKARAVAEMLIKQVQDLAVVVANFHERPGLFCVGGECKSNGRKWSVILALHDASDHIIRDAERLVRHYAEANAAAGRDAFVVGGENMEQRP